MWRLEILFVCVVIYFAHALPGELFLECPFNAEEIHAYMGSPTFEISDVEEFNDIRDSLLTFELVLEDLEDGFLPEMQYNFFVVSYNQFRPINSFLLTVENLDDDCTAGDLRSFTHNVLQVNNCPNFVTSGDLDNKVKVGFRWTAPQCGCVTIRASVKHGQSLYSAALTGEDGALLKTVCMDTIDENDAPDSPDLMSDLEILEDEDILEDESDEEEDHLLEAIGRLTKVDRLCEELSFPNYTNLENILRRCCGISSNIRRRLCFLKTIPHKSHQRKQVKRLCRRLEDEVYGDHPMLASRAGTPFRECCQLSGHRKQLSCMRRTKYVQFDSFCERFESRVRGEDTIEAKHWKKCCAMATTERRRCMSWRNGQSKTDKRCRVLQRKAEGRLTPRQAEMADCCLLEENEGRRQCFKELEWDGYDRMCVSQGRQLINLKDTKLWRSRHHPCCNETENERYECFEESVRLSNSGKPQKHRISRQRLDRSHRRLGPSHRRTHRLPYRRSYDPSYRRQYGSRHDGHQANGQGRPVGEDIGTNTQRRESETTWYSRPPQNTLTNAEEEPYDGNILLRSFTKNWRRASSDGIIRRHRQSHQEQDSNSEISRQTRSAESTPFIPSLLLSVTKLKKGFLGTAETYRINMLCSDLKNQNREGRRGRRNIIQCCTLNGEKRVECIMRSAKILIDAVCDGHMSRVPFQLGHFDEYVHPDEQIGLFTSDHDCCSVESAERYDCVGMATLDELSKRVPSFHVKLVELFFQSMKPSLRFRGQHGDQVCYHTTEFELLIKNVEELEESLFQLEEGEGKDDERDKRGEGQLSRNIRASNSKMLGKFTSIIRKANMPLEKLYEIFHCCSSTGNDRRICLLASWYDSLNDTCGEYPVTGTPRKSYVGLFENVYDIDGDVESCCEEADGRNRQTCFENVFKSEDSYSFSDSLYVAEDFSSYSYSYGSWFDTKTSQGKLEEFKKQYKKGPGYIQDNGMQENIRKTRDVWTSARIFDNREGVFGSTLLQEDSSSEENTEEQHLKNWLLLGKPIGGVCNRILHNAGIASFGSFKTSKKAYHYSDEVNSHATKRDSLAETLKFCCSIANDFIREMCFEDIRAENVDFECSRDELDRTKHRKARKKLQRCCLLEDSERYECINDRDASQSQRQKESQSSWYTRAIIYKYLKRWLPMPSTEAEDEVTDPESRNKTPVDKSQSVAKSGRKRDFTQSKTSTRRGNQEDSTQANMLSRNSVDSGSARRRNADVNTINRCCRAGYENSTADIESYERHPICKRRMRVYTSTSGFTSTSCQKEYYRCCMAPSNTTERRTNTSRG